MSCLPTFTSEVFWRSSLLYIEDINMLLMDLLLLNVLWNLWPNRKFRQSPHFLKPQRPWLFSFQNYYSILVRGYVDVLHIRVHGVPNYVLSFTQGDCQKQVLWKNIVQRNTWTGWELPQRGFKCEIKGTMWGFRPVSITGMKVDLIFPLAEEKWASWKQGAKNKWIPGWTET